MKAAYINQTGPAENILYGELPTPTISPTQCLVKIAAVSVNPIDSYIRGGMVPMKLPFPFIVGCDLAGTVAEAGANVTQFKPGDRVWGSNQGLLGRQGTFAEFAAVEAHWLYPTPPGVSDEQAAAVALVGITAHLGLGRDAKLKSGETLFVNGGSGGVGSSVVQIAKAIGARVAVTCSAAKAEVCRGLGADVVLERSPHDWLADATTAVPGGFDVVLDVIGGDEVERNLKAVALRGTIVQVGLMGGGQTSVNVGLLLAKRAHWVGTTLRTRPLEEKVSVTRRFAAEVLPLFESGRLVPVIDSRFPFDRIADAHRHMEANANAGKILVELPPT